MSSLVGKDVESICGKCGDVWHVAVAAVGTQIVKVQCKQCGAYHRYRPPQKAKGESTSTRRVASAGGSSRASSSAARAPKPPPGPLVAADPLRPIKVYKPHFTFAVGDTIDHVTFGRGVVESLPSHERVQVWFDGERRVLVHARASTGSTTSPAAPPLPERRRETSNED